jgi:hypothetical protein
MPFEKKIDDCRELIKQLLTLLKQRGTIHYNPQVSFEVFVNSVWQTILMDNELSVGAIKLKSILSETDIIMVVGDEIEITEFM